MGCFLLVMEEGGLWGSKHPKPLSPSDTTAVPEAQAAVASLSCRGAALDLGDCLGARVFFFFAGKPGLVRRGKHCCSSHSASPGVVWGFWGPSGASGRATAPGAEHSWDL